jgi:hypothetical protein
MAEAIVYCGGVLASAKFRLSFFYDIQHVAHIYKAALNYFQIEVMTGRH